MAINVSQAFHRTASAAIDDTMTLTKAQMVAVNDNLMPSYYFTVCQDDGFIYLYDKSATPSSQTGKFTKFEGGGGSGGEGGTVLTGTLLASGWSDNVQTVTITGLNADANGVVGMLNTATPTQFEAAENAALTVSAMSANSLTFACEETPLIDIPFGVVIGGGGGGSLIIDSVLDNLSENAVQNKAIADALDGKVDKVDGKGLSTNDYTNADKAIVDGVTTALSGKVDKVTGKGLSTNDYDATEKGKVTKAFKNDDTEFTAIVDGDYIPVYDTSASANKRSLWSNIKSVLKTYFDTLYSTVTTSKTASSGGTALSLVTTGEKYTWNNKLSKPSTTSSTGFLRGDNTWQEIGNNSLDTNQLNRPDRWTANTEINFGNGLYGVRATGTFTATSSGQAFYRDIVASGAANYKIFSYGGCMKIHNSSGSVLTRTGVSWSSSLNKLISIMSFDIGASNNLRWGAIFAGDYATATDTYDVWVTYTKS